MKPQTNCQVILIQYSILNNRSKNIIILKGLKNQEMSQLESYDANKSPPRSTANKSQLSNKSHHSEVPQVTQSTQSMHQNRYQSLSQLHKIQEAAPLDEPPDATARRMIYKYLPVDAQSPPSLFQVSSQAVIHTFKVSLSQVKTFKIDEFNCSDGISLPKWCLDEMNAEKAFSLMELLEKQKSYIRSQDLAENVPMLVKITSGPKNAQKFHPLSHIERMGHLKQIQMDNGESQQQSILLPDWMYQLLFGKRTVDHAEFDKEKEITVELIDPWKTSPVSLAQKIVVTPISIMPKQKKAKKQQLQKNSEMMKKYYIQQAFQNSNYVVIAKDQLLQIKTTSGQDKMQSRQNLVVENVEGSGSQNIWFINIGGLREQGGPHIIINKQLEFEQWIKSSQTAMNSLIQRDQPSKIEAIEHKIPPVQSILQPQNLSNDDVGQSHKTDYPFQIRDLRNVSKISPKGSQYSGRKEIFAQSGQIDLQNFAMPSTEHPSTVQWNASSMSQNKKIDQKSIPHTEQGSPNVISHRSNLMKSDKKQEPWGVKMISRRAEADTIQDMDEKSIDKEVESCATKRALDSDETPISPQSPENKDQVQGFSEAVQTRPQQVQRNLVIKPLKTQPKSQSPVRFQKTQVINYRPVAQPKQHRYKDFEQKLLLSSIVENLMNQKNLVKQQEILIQENGNNMSYKDTLRIGHRDSSKANRSHVGGSSSAEDSRLETQKEIQVVLGTKEGSGRNQISTSSQEQRVNDDSQSPKIDKLILIQNDQGEISVMSKELQTNFEFKQIDNTKRSDDEGQISKSSQRLNQGTTKMSQFPGQAIYMHGNLKISPKSFQRVSQEQIDAQEQPENKQIQVKDESLLESKENDYGINDELQEVGTLHNPSREDSQIQNLPGDSTGHGQSPNRGLMLRGAMGSKLAKRRPNVNIRKRTRLTSSDAITQFVRQNDEKERKNPAIRFTSTKMVNVILQNNTVKSPLSDDEIQGETFTNLIQAKAFHPFSAKGRRDNSNNVDQIKFQKSKSRKACSPGGSLNVSIQPVVLRAVSPGFMDARTSGDQTQKSQDPLGKKLSMKIDMKFNNLVNKRDSPQVSPIQTQKNTKHNHQSQSPQNDFRNTLKLGQVQKYTKENQYKQQNFGGHSPFKLRLSVSKNQNERYDSKLSWFDNTDNFVGEDKKQVLDTPNDLASAKDKPQTISDSNRNNSQKDRQAKCPPNTEDPQKIEGRKYSIGSDMAVGGDVVQDQGTVSSNQQEFQNATNEEISQRSDSESDDAQEEIYQATIPNILHSSLDTDNQVNIQNNEHSILDQISRTSSRFNHQGSFRIRDKSRQKLNIKQVLNIDLNNTIQDQGGDHLQTVNLPQNIRIPGARTGLSGTENTSDTLSNKGLSPKNPNMARDSKEIAYIDQHLQVQNITVQDKDVQGSSRVTQQDSKQSIKDQVKTGIDLNQTLQNDMAFKQPYKAAAWQKVTQSLDFKNKPISPLAQWKKINETNWNIIKFNVDFLEKGVTPENFNNIKIKPLTSPHQFERTMRRPNTGHMSQGGNQQRQLKLSKNKFDRFKQRQRGLQTLCSPLARPLQENEVKVSMMSQSIKSPLMPPPYYSNVNLKTRYSQNQSMRKNQVIYQSIQNQLEMQINPKEYLNQPSGLNMFSSNSLIYSPKSRFDNRLSPLQSDQPLSHQISKTGVNIQDPQALIENKRKEIKSQMNLGYSVSRNQKLNQRDQASQAKENLHDSQVSTLQNKTPVTNMNRRENKIRNQSFSNVYGIRNPGTTASRLMSRISQRAHMHTLTQIGKEELEKIEKLQHLQQLLSRESQVSPKIEEEAPKSSGDPSHSIDDLRQNLKSIEQRRMGLKARHQTMTFSEDTIRGLKATSMPSNVNSSHDPEKSVKSLTNPTREGKTALRQLENGANFDVNDKVNIKDFIEQQQRVHVPNNCQATSQDDDTKSNLQPIHPHNQFTRRSLQNSLTTSNQNK